MPQLLRNSAALLLNTKICLSVPTSNPNPIPFPPPPHPNPVTPRTARDTNRRERKGEKASTPTSPPTETQCVHDTAFGLSPKAFPGFQLCLWLSETVAKFVRSFNQINRLVHILYSSVLNPLTGDGSVHSIRLFVYIVL